MANLVILSLTLTAAAIATIAIGGGRVYSIRSVFLIVWFYYGFAIGIDLTAGITLPYFAGEANLNDPLCRPLIIKIMSHYLMCGVAFLAVYWILDDSRREDQGDKQYAVMLIPISLLVAIHLAVVLFYVFEFFGIDRATRLVNAKSSLQYHFLALLVPLLIALDLLTLINCPDWRGKTATAMALLLALLTGHRIYVLIPVMAFAFRRREAVSRVTLAFGAAAFAGFVFIFKPLYGLGMAWWVGENIDLALLWQHTSVSLAALDAFASYAISAHFLQGECPYWMGSSYVEIPYYLTTPRFLGGTEVYSLAESYMLNHHAALAAQGHGLAFSAIAEAWLNFGPWGPFMLGGFWGALACYHDKRPRGVAYYLVLIMTVRLFRSDFGTLYKNWIVVWGSLFVVVLFVLSLYTILRLARYSQVSRQGIPVHPSPVR